MYADNVARPLPTSGGAPLALPAALNTFMATAAYYAKQLVWNAAGTRFWVACPTGTVATDGGLYSGTALTSATLAVAASYKVTAVALSADGATVFFAARAPQHAIYSIAATCTAACVPALVWLAPSGTELRGLSLAPQPPAAASATPAAVPSASASATVTPPPSPSPSPTASLPAGASPSSSPLPPTLAFAASSLVVLRVGDGSAALTSSTAPLYFDEYGLGGPNGTAWTRLQTVALSGITLSGTDYTQGGFSRAADQGSLALAGVAAPAGTAPLTAVPWFPFDRVIASFDRAGVATLTPIAASVYDGLIKGVCTYDGSGFWVAGNTSTATPVGIGYIARGAAPTALTTVNSLPVADFTACQATFVGGFVAVRSQPSTKTVFIDHAAAGIAAGSPLTLVSGTSSLGTSALTGQPSYGKAVITTLNGARAWVAAVANIVPLLVNVDGGIYVGPGGSGTGYTLAVAITYKVTGLALSPNEATLFFTARAPAHALYSVSAACNTGCAVTQLATAGPSTEFRGLAGAPQPFAPLPSPSPSPSASPLPMCSPNAMRINGTCAPCAAGMSSAGGAVTACTACAAGTSSVAGGPCTP